MAVLGRFLPIASGRLAPEIRAVDLVSKRYPGRGRQNRMSYVRLSGQTWLWGNAAMGA
jgi:hypothetical protein